MAPAFLDGWDHLNRLVGITQDAPSRESAHFNFNEGSGTTSTDSIGGLTATLSSGADFRTSNLPFTGAGSYVGIDGNEFITIEHDEAVAIGTGDFTVAGWFELPNLSYSQNAVLIDGFDTSSGVEGYGLFFHNGALKARVWAGGSPASIDDCDC
jgi:hypothetical protein